MDWDLDMDARILAEPKEVHMADEVAHRLELDIARNGPDNISVNLEVDKRRHEAASIHVWLQFVIGEGDVLGLLLVAVNDTWDAAFAADCAGGPLAGPATRRGLKRDDLCHSQLRLMIKAKPLWPSRCADLPPGVTGVRARADIQTSTPARKSACVGVQRRNSYALTRLQMANKCTSPRMEALREVSKESKESKPVKKMKPTLMLVGSDKGGTG